MTATRATENGPRAKGLLHRLRLAPPMPLAPGQLPVLVLLGFSVALGRYDTELMSLVLPYVQADIGIAESVIASLAGLSKLGIIAGVLLGLLADRFGRARLLAFTILGFSLATAATAFARTPAEFIAAQFLARAFVDTESGLVVVMAVEILASRNRGWALGFGAAFAALGSGVAALAFAFIEVFPGGWRSLYLASFAGIFLLAYMRRNVRETERFAEAQGLARAAGVRQKFLSPLTSLLGSLYSRRLVRLSVAQAIFAFGVASAFALQSKHLIETHGFRPGDITVLFIFGGAVAILGNLAGGTLADRFGRKPVLAIFLVLTAVGIAGFFNASGTAMIAFWILYAFSQFAAGIIFTAYEAELFPTRQRATAGTVTNVAATLGFAVGTLSEGILFNATGSHELAITTLALSVPFAFVAIARALPETANRDLDDVSPDLDAPPQSAAHTIRLSDWRLMP